MSEARDNWQTVAEQGIALLRQNRPQQAVAKLERAARQARGDRTVRYWLANAYRMTGAFDSAYRLFDELLAERPDDFDTAFAFAFLLRDAGRPQEAARALTRAAQDPGLTVDRLLQVAGFLRDGNQFAAAIPVLEKALQRRPKQADLHFKLARLYQATGDFDSALAALRTTLQLDPSTGPAWTVLAQQQRFRSADDEDFLRIAEAATRSHGREADMCIAFACGKALDDLQRWPEAWAEFQRGNRLMESRTPWSADAWKTFVEGKIGGTAAAASRGSVPRSGGQAVFIVGMPRSGTTLLEQLLGRHPDIVGRGELNFLDHFAKQRPPSGSFTEAQRREFGNLLWTQLRLEGPDSGIYIDKNPLNFRFLDTAFELLPDARVLHVTRDGRDSCLSCFFQLFQHEDTAFSYRLDSLADFYAGYRRLMAHWQEIYGDRVYPVSYEGLVNAGSEVLAAVLGFLGADGNIAATGSPGDGDGVIRTASVWQARQAVHPRSVGRWRHYYELAPGFFDRLAAIDAEYDTNR